MSNQKAEIRGSGFKLPVSSFHRAFSLVEVVIAIGIFSFALTLIFGLLPIGIKSGGASVREVDASHLLEHFEQDIRNWKKPATASPIYKIELPAAATTDEKFFDLGLAPVAATDTTRYYRVESTIQTGSNGMNVYLRATWPALASKANAEGSSELVTFVFSR